MTTIKIQGFEIKLYDTILFESKEDDPATKEKRLYDATIIAFAPNSGMVKLSERAINHTYWCRIDELDKILDIVEV
jgi:hypothetical protein